MEMTRENGTPDESVLELRKKYRGYRPFQLAERRGDPVLWEFTSWPWTSGERGELVLIMARRVDDPTSNRSFFARTQIHPVRWSEPRQRAYRLGFGQGVRYAVEAARGYAKPVEKPPSEEAELDGLLKELNLEGAKGLLLDVAGRIAEK